MTPSSIRRLALSAVALAAVGLGLPAQAQQTRLYDPQPPANAAYVRVIAVTGGDYDVWVDQKARLTKVASGTPSPYMVLPPGSQQVEVRAGGQQVSVPVTTQASRSFTILLPELKADKATVVSDKTNSNRLKALIMAYNLGPVAADVATADGQTSIFKALAPNAGNGLVVNPIVLDYKASGDGHTLGSGRMEMAPGGAYTIVLTGTQAANVKAASYANSVERYTGN